MSVDRLQDKIRKSKTPCMVELSLPFEKLPAHLLQEEENALAAYGRFCKELMEGFKGVVPALRFSFPALALYGSQGLALLRQLMTSAREQGYYVVLDAPQILSPWMAEHTALRLLGEDSRCDALVVSSYIGSEGLKPFLPYCKDKAVFAVVRTGNRSGAEIQDLLCGNRHMHMAAADIVNRCGADAIGKRGFSGMGILTGANSEQSLKALRAKYPRIFQLVDGYDYPSANAKKCGAAFDRLGHGAIVCAGQGVTCAWAEDGVDSREYVDRGMAAVQRMKKNLSNYVEVL